MDNFLLTEANEQKKLFGEDSSAKPEELALIDKEIEQELKWAQEGLEKQKRLRFPHLRLSLRKIKLARLNEIIGLKDRII